MADQLELDISISNIKDTLEQFNAELKKTGQISDGTFKSVSSEVSDLAGEMQGLIAVQKEVNADAKKGETAFGLLSSSLKNAIRDFQIGGKSVGEWGNAIKGASSRLHEAISASGKFAAVTKALKFTGITAGIGLLLGVLGSLITYFTKYQSGVDKVSKIMAAATSVIDVLVGRFLKLTSAISNFFSGNWSAAAEDLKASFVGIGDEILSTASKAYELEAALQRLRDDSRTTSVEFARQNAELSKLKGIIDDQTRSINTRAAAQRKAAAIEQQQIDAKLELAGRELDVERQKFFLNTENAAQRDAFAAAEIKYYELVGQATETQNQNEAKLQDIRKEGREKSAKALKEELDSLDKVRKSLEALRVEAEPDGINKELAAVNKKYDDLQKAAQEGAAKLSAIEKKRGLSPQEIADKEEFARISVELENRRTEALLNVLTDYAQKDIEIEAALLAQKEALAKKDFEAATKALENEKALRLAQIDIGEQSAQAYLLRLKASGASEKEIAEAQQEFDLLTKQARLRAELDFQQKLLEIVAEGDPERVAAVKKSIELLNAELSNIDFQINAPTGGKKSFFDLLGIDEKSEDAFKRAVATVADSLRSLADEKVRAAEAAVQAAEKEVSATETAVQNAQDALDREIAIAELGFASDVTRKQAALALAEQEAAQAKAIRDKTLEDQKKAQRQQIILDTVLQSVNLITASSQVLKGFSAIPIIGVPLGIAAVLLMLGAFAKAKATALNAVKARHGIQGEVGRDGIIVGASHEDGGVPLEAEGGEFVYQDGKRVSIVNRRATSAHFGLLQAINKDDRPRMAYYLERLTGGARRSDNGTPSTAIPGAGSSGSDALMRENNRLLKENNLLQQKMLEEERNRTQYVDMGTHIVKSRAGREEIIWKRQQ